ncbi:hypothetical protein FIU57_12080 [Enterococcus faecium]|nr:hypothetical protein FIU57_12080 [Enterococcus faecium]
MTLTISVIYLRKNKGFLQKNIGHSFSLKTKITNKRNPYNDTLSICNKKRQNIGSIIYGTDESELILQPHFHFRY